MWHTVLLELHPMVGIDFHGEITATPIPAPAPFIPHACGMVLHGLTPLGPSLTTRSKTVANYLSIVQKGSDISFLIPHVPIPTWPPCVLAVIITTVGSGSKSEFGPASVIAEGTPIAAALIPIMTNIQLNCGTIPTPTGFVQAPSTVVCGMTWGDILGGLVAMAVDAAVQAAMSYLCSFAGKAAAGKIGNYVVKTVVENLVPAVIQQITGSPIGYTWSAGQHADDPKDSYSPWNPGNWGNIYGRAVSQAVDGAPPGAAPSPGQPATQTPNPAQNPSAHDPSVENH